MEAKVILFKEATALPMSSGESVALKDEKYVLIVGDPAYTENYKVYGPFESYTAATLWRTSQYTEVRKLRDPNDLRLN